MQVVGKIGEVVEVDSKGRIVIPVSIRDRFGIGGGSKLVLELRDSEILPKKYEIDVLAISHSDSHTVQLVVSREILFMNFS